MNPSDTPRTEVTNAKQVADLRKDFKFFTGALKAYEVEKADGSKDLYLSGVASSTVIDRMGDRIDLSAQEQMLASAQAMTLFLNHSYIVPEDVFGTCGDSKLQARTDSEQGACIDLDIVVRIEQESDRAVKCWKMVRNGTKLGFSIGGQVTAFRFEDGPNGPDSVFVITGIKLFEISCVGIPANQRANIAEVITKSLRKKVAGMDEATKKLMAEGKYFETDDVITPPEVQTVLNSANIQRQTTPTEEPAPNDIPAGVEVPVDQTPVSTDVELDLERKCSAGKHVLAKDAGDECPLCGADPDGDPKDLHPDVIGAMRKCYRSMERASMHDQIHKAALGVAMAHRSLAHNAHANAKEILAGLLPHGFEGDPNNSDPSTENPSDYPDESPAGGDNYAADVQYLASALKILKDFSGGEVNDEEVDKTEDLVITLQIETEEAEAKVAALATQISEASDSLTKTQSELVTVQKEVLDLQKQKEELLKARSGRKTVVVLGESTESEPSSQENLYETETEIKARLASKMSGSRTETPTDARSRSDAN